jgi:hypothetical protein
VKELHEQRADEAQARAGVVLAVALTHEQLVQRRIELGAQQARVVGVAERRRRRRDRIDVGFPGAQAGDSRRACRFARDRQLAVRTGQAEGGRGDRIVAGDGVDIGVGDGREPLVRRRVGARPGRDAGQRDGKQLRAQRGEQRCHRRLSRWRAV